MWTAPDGFDCARMRSLLISYRRRPSVEQISRIGMDRSKHVFQRKEMMALLAKLEPTEIAIETCGASHH